MSHQVQVLAVTGGKGGVGKSNVSVNLAVALAGLGKRVTVLDADLGLANIDVLLGIKGEKTLAEVLEGSCDLKDIMINGPGGIRIVPASSGTQHMTNLSEMQHAGVINAFGELADQMDYLIVDTAAGISQGVVSFLRASQEVLFIVCDEPTSITDAYALMKLLFRDHNMFRFRVIANMVKTPQEGRQLFKKLSTVIERFLDEVVLQFVGSVPMDENVKKAVKKQKAFVEQYPSSPASQAVKAIARQVDQWPVPAAASGHLEFFVERLVNTA